MQRMNPLKEKIRAGKKMIGTHVSLVDPSVCEILGLMGFDYIWIDMEHTCIDFQVLNQCLMAVRSAGGSPIVRVPQHDYTFLKKVLEMGPDGIVFPMIRNVEEAREDIANTLYPPYGVRGFGPRSAIGYGLCDVREYIEKKSLDMCRFIQIEHINAVNCLPDLLEIPFVDGFVIGPCDLSGSINQLCNHYGTDTRELIEKTIKQVHEANRYVCFSVGDFSQDKLRYWCSMGLDMISAGADTDFIIYGAKTALAALQKEQLHQ
jgi:2-dehydro-3-deoxyglucarate aldolase/4-hydroxy-2-oxoheptanedioate aldolase